MDEVTLQILKTEHLEALMQFHLPVEQEQFTSLPKELLENTQETYPIVIFNKLEPVGFFVLHSSTRVQEYTDNTKAMLLTAFSIDHKHQGKGYAQNGLNQIIPFLNKGFPSFDEVVLAVNHKNISAQKLYEKVGFIDTGKRKIGKLGEQFILSKPIT